ncbi:Uncharacterised protein [Yersinia pekkanenii]|uniref:Uncharacterized protein n=1 Tax=Yersinia pekkanenii TaxID=1288385 RepID=A0A0T9PTE7_9GAMM|nr:hypothetical protein [Yersinia pekkanenii]CNH81364.1 Uncharacterised protein [Yersinia pekkanenii]
MNYNTIYKNLKVTFFENRFASDNAELIIKAKEQGRTVARTIHTETTWCDYVSMVMDKSKWITFTATTPEQYSKEKEQFDGVVFAEMIPNTARSAKNVIAHHAIVLDIDAGITLEEVKLDLEDFEYVLYSSGGTGIKCGERFRVVLPLQNPISAEEYNNYALGLKQRFPYSDESFSKSLQIQYSPMLNTVIPELFIAYHGQGKFFNIDDDVELISQEDAYISNVQFTNPEFTDEFTSKLLNALVEHNAGQLAYEERRILANRMVSAGISHFDMVQVLDRTGRAGASHSGADIANMANAQYGHVLGLRKNLPQDFQFEFKVQPTVIQHSPKVDVVNNYDAEFWLAADQYLDSISNQIDWDHKLILLHADVGVGKNHFFKGMDNHKVVAPLTSIVVNNTTQVGSNINNIHVDSIATWNQVLALMNQPAVCKDLVLVIDECHGLIFDYSYKSKTIKQLYRAIGMFKSVVMMSGTIEPNYFSKLKFDKVYRVHKKQLAVKSIQTIICEDKTEALLQDLLLEQHKSIVLINNKELSKVIISRLESIGKKCLEVNADVKNSAAVVNFFTTKQMGSYDFIIGTNSIIEGLSIEGELEQAVVYIWDSLDPDRIEQFTNRFRNVTRSKSVKLYKPRSEVLPVQIENVQSKIEAAQKVADGLNEYVSLLSLNQKSSFRNSFKNEIFGDLVIWNSDLDIFDVNYPYLDFESAQIRSHNSNHSFEDFSNRMMCYDFTVYYPQWRLSDADVRQSIKVEAKANKANTKQSHDVLMAKLADDFSTGNFTDEHDNQEQHDEYWGVHDSVASLLDVGLAKSDAPIVVMNYMNDKNYIADAWTDYNNQVRCNSVLDLIRQELSNCVVNNKGKILLLSQDADRIAHLVAQKVLSVYYMGDIDRMIGSDQWGSDLVKVVKKDTNEVEVSHLGSCFLYKMEDQVSHFEIKQNRSRTILSRYITLSSSTQIRLDSTRQRAFQVIHENLTGLEFTPIDNEQQQRDKLAAIIASKRDGQSIVVRDETIVVDVSAINNDSIVESVSDSKPTNKARAFMKLL